MRSISPTTSARVGAVGTAARATWANAGDTSRKQSAATTNRRTVKSDERPAASFDLMFMTTTPCWTRAFKRLSRATPRPPAPALVGVAFQPTRDGCRGEALSQLLWPPRPRKLRNCLTCLRAWSSLARPHDKRGPVLAQAQQLGRGQLRRNSAVADSSGRTPQAADFTSR